METETKPKAKVKKKVEKVKTIMDIDSHLTTDCQVRAKKTIVEFNSALVSLGYKKAKLSGPTFKSDTLEKELIIYFYPSFSGLETYGKYWDHSSTMPLYKHIRGLSGHPPDTRYYRMLVGGASEKIELDIDFSGEKIHIGDYLPNQNVVLIYLSCGWDNWTMSGKNAYMEFLIQTIKEVTKKYKIKERDYNEIKKNFFVSVFTQSITQEMARGVRYIIEGRNSIHKYGVGIVESCQKIQRYKTSNEGLKVLLKDTAHGLYEKIDSIKELSFVTGVTTDNKGIHVSLSKIFIKVKGKDIEMGDYVLNLMPKKIGIVNKKPVVYGGCTFHSPHISGDNICFGSSGKKPYDLLGRLELKKLVHYLYLYLRSYNPEDTYLSMNYWIKERDNQRKVKEANEKAPAGLVDELDTAVAGTAMTSATARESVDLSMPTEDLRFPVSNAITDETTEVAEDGMVISSPTLNRRLINTDIADARAHLEETAESATWRTE